MKRKRRYPAYPYLIYLILVTVVIGSVFLQYRSSRNRALEKLNTDTEYNSIVLSNDFSRVLEKSEMILDLLESKLQNEDEPIEVEEVLRDFRHKYFDIDALYLFSGDGFNYTPPPDLLEEDLEALFNYHKETLVRSHFSFNSKKSAGFWLSRAIFDSQNRLKNVLISSVSIDSFFSFDEIKAMYGFSDFFILDSDYKVLHSGRGMHPVHETLDFTEGPIPGLTQFTGDRLSYGGSKITGYPFFLTLESDSLSILPPIRQQFLLYSLMLLILLLFGFFLIHHLVSQNRKQNILEEQLQQQSKLEAIGRVTGGVAHEFNNINLAIMSASELMKESSSPEETDSYMSMILKSIKRASSIIQDLLSYSRSNFMVLKNNLNVPDLITETVNRALNEQEKSVNIQISNHRKVDLYGDRKLLSDALFNIIENAVHAVEDEETVIIDYRVVAGDEISYADAIPNEKKSYIEITVEDSGTGIPHENLDKVFDPFFSTRAPGKGVGLGLSSVYGIVKEHNGFISVDSIPGEGTVFRIALPLN